MVVVVIREDRTTVNAFERNTLELVDKRHGDGRGQTVRSTTTYFRSPATEGCSPVKVW